MLIMCNLRTILLSSSYSTLLYTTLLYPILPYPTLPYSTLLYSILLKVVDKASYITWSVPCQCLTLLRLQFAENVKVARMT